MRYTLHGARLVDATMDREQGTILVEDERIQAIEPTSNSAEYIIDASDTIIMPGFIEVHTHGGGGFNLHTTEVDEIRAYRHWIPTTGVTSFLIAVVGTPNAVPETQLRTAVAAIELETQPRRESGAEPVGIHLEGPYISLHKRGAHPPYWLRQPEPEETEHILSLTKGYLQLITVAPELPGAYAMIRRMVEAGVTVSIGHTDANYEQACESIKLGITHATHCFNAMRQLKHREPGPLAAIVQSKQVLGEIIGDGIHVHPAMIDMLVRLLGPEHTIVVTDALAGAGMTDATFEFAGQEAHVICGAARLNDGTLTGSVLTLDQALRNMLQFTQVSLADVSGMLSYNPARSAHVADRKGLLKVGYDADLVIYNKDLELQATICRGQVGYVTDQWRQRLNL
ncbi:N-acetylglucosamine-6-phosphate deacetylase [Dictyobacter arantiisoli]|uniref:N-acetylglucosamine-6-phosphate deacetylase n=1 Tax=Dictyobacter arantiisoli TaxID=2014874 RepID=A0A5A5T5K7_9CHLR|nr:N-acetylglucosamine-6-phosphate deacetylase [Dictyobacter arantiisoli]GCF06485.1 N-acetylglucosamine-6-phosphate deacetylase [Dictyobacter arantiisoli]